MQHKTAEKCLNFTLECLISFVWMSKKSVQVWGESPLKTKRGRRKMGITRPSPCHVGKVRGIKDGASFFYYAYVLYILGWSEELSFLKGVAY